jgi:hypothetical protein
MHFLEIVLVALGVSNVLAFTTPSLTSSDALIEARSNCGDEPFDGCTCTSLADCNVYGRLFCATAEQKCRERAYPGAKCVAGELSCFVGECTRGYCGGINEGAQCTRDVDCTGDLVCRPEPTDRVKGYEFQCQLPARAKNFGARCRSDSDCGFPFFCVLESGQQKYCGVNPTCKRYRESCSTDKDCCRMKCVSEARDGYLSYHCSTYG